MLSPVHNPSDDHRLKVHTDSTLGDPSDDGLPTVITEYRYNYKFFDAASSFRSMGEDNSLHSSNISQFPISPLLLVLKLSRKDTSIEGQKTYQELIL